MDARRGPGSQARDGAVCWRETADRVWLHDRATETLQPDNVQQHSSKEPCVQATKDCNSACCCFVVVVVVVVVDRFYIIALFSALEQTRCVRM